MYSKNNQPKKEPEKKPIDKKIHSLAGKLCEFSQGYECGFTFGKLAILIQIRKGCLN